MARAGRPAGPGRRVLAAVDGSDGPISLRVANLPQPPILWIMSTYILAQYLVASGVLGETWGAPAVRSAASIG